MVISGGCRETNPMAFASSFVWRRKSSRRSFDFVKFTSATRTNSVSEVMEYIHCDYTTIQMNGKRERFITSLAVIVLACLWYCPIKCTILMAVFYTYQWKTSMYGTSEH
jgi:hypothetical protein